MRAVILFAVGLAVAGVPLAGAQVPSAALGALDSASLEERRGAADALSTMTASPDAVEAVGRQLAAFRQANGDMVATLMAELRPAGAKDADMVERLLQHKPDAAVSRALATVCMMRGLAHVGSLAALRRLVQEASDAEGAFRPELLRLLKDLDERATAALIEARADPSGELREWAKDVLEVLGRRTPGDMVQTNNDQILVDVLHAYGRTNDIDAVPVVLSFVNSARVQVRLAAREATLAFGPSAVPKLRATYAALTGEAPNEDAEHIAQALFDAYDHQRLRDVYALLDDGLAKQRAGDVDAAVVAFDAVLAREPLLDRRAEMVPAYVAFAEGLEHAEPRRAVEYLRRALRIDTGGSRSNHVRSEILYLEGEALESRGLSDTSAFEEALALDAQNEHAHSQLMRLRAEAEQRRTQESRVAAGVIAAGIVLLAIGAIAARAHRQRTHRGA